MPSVQQIKKPITVTQNPPRKKLNAFAKAMAGVAVLCGMFYHFGVTKMEKIPENIAENALEQSPFDYLLKGGKKIVWFGADCSLSAARKDAVDKLLKARGLNKFYEQKAFLQNSYSSSCSNRNCLDVFLIENCSENYCILIPSQNKFIKVDFEKGSLFTTLDKFKNM